MRNKYTNLTEQMAEKGYKLRTWANAKKLSDSDYKLLLNMSYGKTKGTRGRAKQLKEILEEDGFKLS